MTGDRDHHPPCVPIPHENRPGDSYDRCDGGCGQGHAREPARAGTPEPAARITGVPAAERGGGMQIFRYRA